MPISLKILSYHRHTPGQQEIFKTDSNSFTIGRNDENDWAIPDPQRFLSGVHCRLHYESGRYYLTDISTNGVFVNGAENRMNRDSSVAVSHHDRFRIGDYEFEVLLEDNNFADDDDEEPFDDMATMVGQGQPEDEFEDDFDDPFSDPVPQQSHSSHARQDDFEKDINTPLQHMDSNPIPNAISIESLLDLDDLEDEKDQDSTESLRERHSPLNDAFRASKHIPQTPASTQQGEFESDFPSDIPDDWDEATGMLKIPDAPAHTSTETDSDTDPFLSDEERSDERLSDEDLSDQDSSEESLTNQTATSESMDLPDEWEDALDIFDDAEVQSPPQTPKPVVPATVAKPAAAEKPDPLLADTFAETPAKAVHSTPSVTTDRPADFHRTPGALAAFITGAGLSADDLKDIDEQAFFEQLGSMMAAFTTGMIQTLSGRTHIKSEFRLDQTMIRPVENNPLKFSTSTTSTLKQLLTQKDTAYMTGVTAIKEGFDDVNAHQMAVIAGMEAALQDILKRFNPDALEKRLESDSILDNILPGGKKAKYWEMFKVLFDQIAGEAEDDFQQLFGSKFSRAYEQQLDRLKNNH